MERPSVSFAEGEIFGEYISIAESFFTIKSSSGLLSICPISAKEKEFSFILEE
jgi:hypothetical protein